MNFTASIFVTAFSLSMPLVNNAAEHTRNNALCTDMRKGIFDSCKRNMEACVKVGLPLLCATYLYDRSIACVHEGAHAAMSKLTGNKTSIYLSLWIGGGGYIVSSCPQNTFKAILIDLAGPLASTAMCFLWLPIWNMVGQYLTTDKDAKQIFKDGKKSFLNEHSSFPAIFGSFCMAAREFSNLIPKLHKCDATYGMMAGVKHPTDGLKIQRALMTVAPSLVKIYPYLSYAGYVGLLGYGLYGIYVTYRAKKLAGQKLW